MIFEIMFLALILMLFFVFISNILNNQKANFYLQVLYFIVTIFLVDFENPTPYLYVFFYLIMNFFLDFQLHKNKRSAEGSHRSPIHFFFVLVCILFVMISILFKVDENTTFISLSMLSEKVRLIEFKLGGNEILFFLLAVFVLIVSFIGEDET